MKIEPCPVCGNAKPDVDHGLEGVETIPMVFCQTVHVLSGPDEHTQVCPMHAQGIGTWNYLAKLSRSQYEL